MEHVEIAQHVLQLSIRQSCESVLSFREKKNESDSLVNEHKSIFIIDHIAKNCHPSTFISALNFVAPDLNICLIFQKCSLKAESEQCWKPLD